MALSVAICDDAPPDAACVEALVRDWAAARGEKVCVRAFPSAESFLFAWDGDRRFDILLLDIEMGRMDGVALAKRVRRESETVQIVFITGYMDYLADGYDVEALHYLLKPVRAEKLAAVLDRAVRRLRQDGRCLDLEAGGELWRIPVREIRYLTVCQNYVTVYAKREYTVRRTLTEFEKELGEGFHRVGRGMILHLRWVARVTKTQVTLTDGTVLPLPRGAYEPLNRAIIGSGV